MAIKGTLPPGFRFHPTDNELVLYYLKRKLTHKPFHVEAVTEIDLYKYAPWELPEKSCLRTRDRIWYFFCARDRKYTNGMRTNRATSNGYWKTTGNDRPVVNNARTVGMKKTLIFHQGKAPRGERTDWVMYEYRIEDKDLAASGIQPDAFVICKIFHKSGLGPKAGEQYGAPFDEEEWEEDVELDLQSGPLRSFINANNNNNNTVPAPSSSHENNTSLPTERMNNNNNNTFQPRDVRGNSVNPCPLQAQRSSKIDEISPGDMSFDIVQLQELLQTSGPPIEENHNDTIPVTEDAIFENLENSSYEAGTNIDAEMYHSDDYDMVNGDAFDTTTILSELGSEHFIELSDFLSVMGLSSDDNIPISKGSFIPSRCCCYYPPHFR